MAAVGGGSGGGRAPGRDTGGSQPRRHRPPKRVLLYLGGFARCFPGLIFISILTIYPRGRSESSQRRTRLFRCGAPASACRTARPRPGAGWPWGSPGLLSGGTLGFPCGPVKGNKCWGFFPLWKEAQSRLRFAPWPFRCCVTKSFVSFFGMCLGFEAAGVPGPARAPTAWARAGAGARCRMQRNTVRKGSLCVMFVYI